MKENVRSNVLSIDIPSNKAVFLCNFTKERKKKARSDRLINCKTTFITVEHASQKYRSRFFYYFVFNFSSTILPCVGVGVGVGVTID